MSHEPHFCLNILGRGWGLDVRCSSASDGQKASERIIRRAELGWDYCSDALPDPCIQSCIYSTDVYVLLNSVPGHVLVAGDTATQ